MQKYKYIRCTNTNETYAEIQKFHYRGEEYNFLSQCGGEEYNFLSQCRGEEYNFFPQCMNGCSMMSCLRGTDM